MSRNNNVSTCVQKFRRVLDNKQPRVRVVYSTAIVLLAILILFTPTTIVSLFMPPLSMEDKEYISYLYERDVAPYLLGSQTIIEKKWLEWRVKYPNRAWANCYFNIMLSVTYPNTLINKLTELSKDPSLSGRDRLTHPDISIANKSYTSITFSYKELMLKNYMNNKGDKSWHVQVFDLFSHHVRMSIGYKIGSVILIILMCSFLPNPTFKWFVDKYWRS